MGELCRRRRCRLDRVAAMNRPLSHLFNRLVIVVPYLWLLALFLIPFVIVFKISLSQPATAMPPYVPTFEPSEGLAGLWTSLKAFSFDNYLWLTEDALYFNAYV